MRRPPTVTELLSTCATIEVWSSCPLHVHTWDIKYQPARELMDARTGRTQGSVLLHSSACLRDLSRTAATNIRIPLADRGHAHVHFVEHWTWPYRVAGCLYQFYLALSTSFAPFCGS